MSHFVYESVLKAKRPNWSRTRNPKRLEALSKRFGSSFQVDLINGIKTFKKRIPNPERLYDAWMSGGWEEISRLIPWHRLDEDLSITKSAYVEGLAKFGEIGLEAIAAPARKEFRYDLKNPAILSLAKKRVGEKIVRPIERNGRENIRRIVQLQMKNGASPRDMAKQIKGFIGLDERRETALRNYSLAQAKSGVSPENQVRNNLSYADRLLTQRAKGIARTETQFMMNRGQLEVWREGIKQDLLPSDSEKEWVVDGNPCPICEDMDGISIPMDEMFDFDGDMIDGPPGHTNCECMLTINF